MVPSTSLTQTTASSQKNSNSPNELTLVGDFIRPNGLAFSPDEKKLYIDDSERWHIRVFDVHADESLSGSDLFYDMNADIPGSPDGMKVGSCLLYRRQGNLGLRQHK